jgi:hypothetical protein
MPKTHRAMISALAALLISKGQKYGSSDPEPLPSQPAPALALAQVMVLMWGLGPG